MNRDGAPIFFDAGDEHAEIVRGECIECVQHPCATAK
jgi:hypothetical protein